MLRPALSAGCLYRSAVVLPNHEFLGIDLFRVHDLDASNPARCYEGFPDGINRRRLWQQKKHAFESLQFDRDTGRRRDFALGCRVRSSALVSTSSRGSWPRRRGRGVGIMTVYPCIELPGPLCRVCFLKMSDRSRLYMLLGDLLQPAFHCQPMGFSLGLQRRCFFVREFNGQIHTVNPSIFPA